MGTKIHDMLPEFVDSIVSSLLSDGRADLADQLMDLEVSRTSYDPAPGVKALYIFLTGQRRLNIVEKNIVGSGYTESIPIEGFDGMVVVDIDNFDRLTGIEIIDREDLAIRLGRIQAPPKF